MFLGASSAVRAFEIPTGNDDWAVRWDNTVKYNFGERADSLNTTIANTPNYNYGDNNFRRGIVTSRLDDYSELDVIYKKDMGIRVSGALWYDPAYAQTFDNLAEGQHPLDTRAQRLFEGPNGELLDAFAFDKLDAGGIPVNIKVGRHTIYWGEALLNAQGIAYSQAPIDAAKAVAVPGSELKELYRPLDQISMQAQLTDELSIALQKYLEYEPYRLTEAGSYLGFFNFYLTGAQPLFSAGLTALGPFGVSPYIPHGTDVEPNGMNDWGAALRWSPNWLEGTAGLYYRRFADMVPGQLYIQEAYRTLPVIGKIALPSNYFWAYGDNIDLVGMSLSRQIYGIAAGLELSYRHNMPLANDAVVLLPGQTLKTGDLLGARGQTMHGDLNFIGLLSKNPLWDEASYLVELGFDHLLSVDSGEQYYVGRGGVTDGFGADKWAAGIGATFTPTWVHVFPGMDLSAPLSVSWGFIGESCVASSYSADVGNYSVGLSLDIYQKYTVTLAWIDYFGPLKTANGQITAIESSNPVGALLQDRGWVSLTLKATF
jgi:hypothetical protein